MKAGTDLPALTGLRGVAAIYVILFHYVGPEGPWRTPSRSFIGHGYLGVDIFFVLSGFVMALNYRHLFATQFSFSSFKKFLGRRIARIYPLYFVTMLVAAILVIRFGTPPLHIPFGWAFLQNLFMVQVWAGGDNSFNAPAWSLSVEWGAYLVFPILIVPSLFRGVAAAVLVTVVCIGTIVVLHYGLPALPGIPVFHLAKGFDTRTLMPRGIAEFTLGIVTFRLASSPNGAVLENRPLFVTGLALLIVALLCRRGTDTLIIMLLPVLFLGLCFGNALPKRLLSSKAAIIAGELSYSLYLTHSLMSPLIDYIVAYCHKMGIHHGQGRAAAVALALTIPISVLLYNFLEKPSRSVLRKIFEGDARREVAAVGAGD